MSNKRKPYKTYTKEFKVDVMAGVFCTNRYAVLRGLHSPKLLVTNTEANSD